MILLFLMLLDLCILVLVGQPQSVNPSSVWRKLREYSVRELEGLLYISCVVYCLPTL